ncbi:MAG: hypothetical protein GEU97_07170 [Actinophytocola sp.]|nr:hypothetical protein [Actinophytocola sp.]
MSGSRVRRSVKKAVGPKVGFFGILCSGNLGNDGSLEAVVQGLKQRRPDARLEFLCMGPEEATARYGAPATARISGTKVALVSVGANVSRQRLIRWLHTAAARMAYYRTYRDAASFRAMRRMGVDVASDAIYPDLVFALDAPPVPSRPTGCVGVGLMEYRGDNNERARSAELHLNYVATMKQFVRWLADSGRTVRLFTGDRQDEAVLAEIMQCVGPRSPPRVLVEPAATLGDLMRQMATADIVVGTRYHNVLCGLRLAKPTLSVGYATKHHELMAGVGLGEFSLDARHTGFGVLVERFTELERRSDEIEEHLVERNRAYAAQLDDQFAHLFASLFGAHPRRTDNDQSEDR